jgi:hypothetical protein
MNDQRRSLKRFSIDVHDECIGAGRLFGFLLISSRDFLPVLASSSTLRDAAIHLAEMISANSAETAADPASRRIRAQDRPACVY